MASNDGARLAVFGLTFRQHDNRQMQQILREYGRLPSNPGNRATLFIGLFDLSKALEDDDVRGISSWLHDGGVPDDFPTPRLATPPPDPTNDLDIDGDQATDAIGGDDEWEEYDPVAFEAAGTEDAGNYEAEDAAEDHSSDVDEPSMPVDDEHVDDSIPAVGHGELRDVDEDMSDLRTANNNAERPENYCAICYCGMDSPEELAPKEITSTCKHDHDDRACFDCLKHQLSSNIEDGQLSLVKCPHCLEVFSTEEVKRYATPQAFARYEYLVMLANPDIVMCLRKGCESGQLHPDTANPKMICIACSFATCARHRLPWHEGQTCEEFDCSDDQIERLEQAEATAKLLAKDQSKICPSCKQGVTKQDGCDHLHCRCGKEWCFICLASWENIMRIGADAHAPTCTSHPNRVHKTKKQLAAGHAQMTETLLGGPASEALLRARDARNERVRADIRPKALEAAEARVKAMREAKKGKENEGQPEPKKKRVRLLPAWEE